MSGFPVPNRVFMQIKEFSWLSGHKGDEREGCVLTPLFTIAAISLDSHEQPLSVYHTDALSLSASFQAESHLNPYHMC